MLDGFGLPYWLDMERPTFPRLEHDVTADVAIVGAGLAGLKLAHHLARHNLSVVICEGGRVGDGASGRNQGTINHGPNMAYGVCARRHSRPVARDLWQLGLENHRRLRDLIGEYEIACDYERLGEHFLARRDDPDCEAELAQLREDHRLLHEDGFDVDWLDEPAAIEMGGSRLFAGGLVYRADAQFHPGKFVIGLARGVARRRNVALHEQTRVLDIRRDGPRSVLVTGNAVVAAEHVFLALNATAPQLVRSLEDSLRAERGQVLVTEPLSRRPCAGSFGTFRAWWREIAEPEGRYRLLFGGGRSRDAPDSLFRQFDAAGRPHPRLQSEGFSPSVEHQRRLHAELVALFPDVAGARVTHRWGGLQSFTSDMLPVVGVFDPERRIHGIAGFCGRGNCHSDVGAEFLAGRVVGKPSQVEMRFGDLFTRLMAVGRSSAVWAPWVTSDD